MDLDATKQLYRGYDNEDGLSLNGCIFRTAQHLRLVSSGETGFGWSNAEICDLADRVRISIEYDPAVLDDLPQNMKDKLLDGLNISFA